MNGLSEIIRNNARAAGREGFTFLVSIDADPKEVIDFYEQPEVGTPADFARVQRAEDLIRSEIESWLHDLDYVHSVCVRRKW